MKHVLIALCACGALLSACGGPKANEAEAQPPAADSTAGPTAAAKPDTEPIHYPEETHLTNVRQLTFGGNNAEAYWSFDDQQLVFQSDYSGWGASCDQIL